MNNFLLITLLSLVLLLILYPNAVQSFLHDKGGNYDYTKLMKENRVKVHKSIKSRHEQYKLNGPFIVHLNEDVHVPSFQRSLHETFQWKNQDIPSTNTDKESIYTKFNTNLLEEILPNSILVYGLKYDEIVNVPGVESVVPNTIKRIMGMTDITPHSFSLSYQFCPRPQLIIL